jgi:hypothetical protein
MLRLLALLWLAWTARIWIDGVALQCLVGVYFVFLAYDGRSMCGTLKRREKSCGRSLSSNLMKKRRCGEKVWKRTDANYLSRNIPRSDGKAADSADCLTGSFTAGRMNARNTKMCCISVSKCAVDLGTNGNSAHCTRTKNNDIRRRAYTLTHTHTARCTRLRVI